MSQQRARRAKVAAAPVTRTKAQRDADRRRDQREAQLWAEAAATAPTVTTPAQARAVLKRYGRRVGAAQWARLWRLVGDAA